MGKNENIQTLDLHGVKEDDVFDLVDRFITKQSNAGREKIRIMPGKGKGVVKKKVLEYLKLGGYPYALEKLANGTTNDGVLVVHI